MSRVHLGARPNSKPRFAAVAASYAKLVFKAKLCAPEFKLNENRNAKVNAIEMYTDLSAEVFDSITP